MMIEYDDYKVDRVLENDSLENDSIIFLIILPFIIIAMHFKLSLIINGRYPLILGQPSGGEWSSVALEPSQAP